MIVDDLNIPSFTIAPYETHSPLVVDTNAVLTLAVAVQHFQTVSGRYAQIVELLGCVDRKKLRTGAPLNLRRQIADRVSREDRRRASITKALDHDGT